MNLTAVAM